MPDIEQIWSAALGALALVITHMAGSGFRAAWILGLFAQLGWLGYIVYTDTYGFVVSFIGFTYVYARNLKKWTKKRSEEKAREENTAELPHGWPCPRCGPAMAKTA